MVSIASHRGGPVGRGHYLVLSPHRPMLVSHILVRRYSSPLPPALLSFLVSLSWCNPSLIVSMLGPQRPLIRIFSLSLSFL